MRAVENRRKQNKKLRRAFCDDDYKRLNFILVPKSQNWERIVEPTKIVKNILQRNKQHFNQASETPFGQETIQKLLGWSGTSKECVNLMNGKVPSELWKQCTQPCAGDLFALFGEEPLSAAPDEISFQEMKAAYQAWPEKTATSPLGRNLSHYKELLIQDTEEQENQTGEKLLQSHHKFLSTILRSGVIPSRWKICASCAIKKDPGVPKISRLRIVHLYEADFNLFTKVIWERKLVQHAEYLQALGDDQFGSRPHKSCLDIVAQKMFTFNITRLTRQRLITFDNNATSCFDRQIPTFAMMVCQKFGLSPQMCEIFTKTLQEMRYHMRMGSDLSEEFYQHSPEHYIFGTGQGNGALAPIWLFTSVFLMKVLRRLHPGMTFKSPDNKLQYERPIDSIVDDTMVGTNHGHDRETIAANATAIAQTWADILWLSGGALELRKCYFYSVNWSWKNSKAVMDQYNPWASIKLKKSDSEEPTVITQISTKVAKRTLGVRLSPSGNLTDKLDHLKAKAI